jgi:hypothetical protein
MIIHVFLYTYHCGLCKPHMSILLVFLNMSDSYKTSAMVIYFKCSFFWDVTQWKLGLTDILDEQVVPKISVTINQHYLTSQKSEYLIYAAAEAWNKAVNAYIPAMVPQYLSSHTQYCTLFRTNSIQPNFPIVSHRILLYVHLHKLVHLGPQTKILYAKLAAQFVLNGHRLWKVQCCKA